MNEDNSLVDTTERPSGERLRMLIRAYTDGPRSDTEAEEILADEILVTVLRNTWRRNPPTAELQQKFTATGPMSRRLLETATPT